MRYKNLEEAFDVLVIPEVGEEIKNLQPVLREAFLLGATATLRLMETYQYEDLEELRDELSKIIDLNESC